MSYPIGARLAHRRILALDTLYHHLFSTPGRDATTTNQLKHDLVLWLTHHSFEELPDALEYENPKNHGKTQVFLVWGSLTKIPLLRTGDQASPPDILGPNIITPYNTP